jgi:hypothetical protein
MPETAVKRKGGQQIENKWLVLTESTGEPGVGFTHNCGETIMAVNVRHPIWEGPIPCQGFGRCKVVETPFCPKCEEKPDEGGSIIQL